jgi:hypothetical protein
LTFKTRTGGYKKETRKIQVKQHCPKEFSAMIEILTVTSHI